MTTPFLFQLSLFSATLLCALVAGLVLGFAVVVMPGIRRLEDREFLRAFKVMDGVIQNNQPLFMFVWVGSILAVVATLALGIGNTSGLSQLLLLAATLLYLLGVQLPTIRFNIPLNNQIQRLNLDTMEANELRDARETFEPNWNRWNQFRTVVSCISVGLMLALIFRL